LVNRPALIPLTVTLVTPVWSVWQSSMRSCVTRSM
jgi:hypothetical protein